MTHPLLLELNTRCWLQELSAARGSGVTLATVPERSCEEWCRMGVTHVWLMGVWSTGPRSRQRALANDALRKDFARVWPDWREEDVAGSPYAIERYEVPDGLGGAEALARFRRILHQRGLKLILDFVPNHVGLDHPWIDQHPDYFVQSDSGNPSTFRQDTRDGTRWIANGRDPYFAAWDDTAQLDYRRADVHRAMREQLLRIAALCDGVRCDMAMLLLRDVFETTWKDLPMRGRDALRVEEEFWGKTIPAVKAAQPGFLFLAEVYWNLEERLQALGFDYTYDKVLTDELLRRQGVEAVNHIRGRSARFVGHSAHFLENHDEVRVASKLSLEEHRAAALVTLALPGMRFLYDGQTSGATLRIPVQLGRRPSEPVNQPIRGMYEQLLGALRTAGVGQGEGRILPVQPAWAGNPTAETILVILWGNPRSQFALIVVNLAGHRAQCRVPLETMPPLPEAWHLADRLGGECWTRSTEELRQPGLFLDVPKWAAQVFLCNPA